MRYDQGRSKPTRSGMTAVCSDYYWYHSVNTKSDIYEPIKTTLTNSRSRVMAEAKSVVEVNAKKPVTINCVEISVR